MFSILEYNFVLALSRGLTPQGSPLAHWQEHKNQRIAISTQVGA